MAIKVLREGSLPPFLLSAIFVALPCIAFMIYVDSLYYGGEDWTITSYNFLRVNVLEGLSKYFGEDPWQQYIINWSAGFFLSMYPFVAYANTVGHIDIMWSKEQIPYLAYYIIFYILVFSLIPHKEARFLVPLIPFLLLLTGEHVASSVKNHKWVYKIAMWLYMLINIGIISFKFFFHQRVWEVSTYLINKGEPIHSIYSMEHYMTAHYSWYHGFDTKLYPTATFPVF